MICKVIEMLIVNKIVFSLLVDFVECWFIIINKYIRVFLEFFS